jgi:hypothetical protein
MQQTTLKRKHHLEDLMKNLIIGLLLLATVISCGKKNSVSTNVSSPAPITVSGTTEISVGNIIDSNQFGTGTVYVYNIPENWNQYISQMPNVTYQYGKVSCGSSFCYTFFGKSNVTKTVTRTVVNSSVNVETKKNELKALINSRLRMQQISSTAYQIVTTNGSIYIIDTFFPVQANPVYFQDVSGHVENYLGSPGVTN